MEQLFHVILQNSKEACALMLVVILVRACFKKIPKQIRCIMWGIVGLKLIIPIHIESPFSLVPRQMQTGNSMPSLLEVPQAFLQGQILNSTTGMGAQMGKSISIWAIIWMLGTIGLFAYTFITYLMLKRKVAISHRIRRNVYECDYISDPFILGMLKPIIYVPSSLSDDALECVLRHERTHLQRLDFLWKPLGFAILCFYWINPLCWVSYILLCRDIEYACDEAAAMEESNEWRANYCQVLLECSVSKKTISACPVAFSENSVKGRVKNMLNYKKPKLTITVLSLVACAIIVACFATSQSTKAEAVENNQTEIADTTSNMDESYSDSDGMLMENVTYDFGTLSAEPRGYYFDGHYLFFIYDIVNDPDIHAITVNVKDEDVPANYYVSNGLDEDEMQGEETRIVMRAIFYFEEYRDHVDLVIGAKDSDIVYECNVMAEKESDMVYEGSVTAEKQ